MTKTVTMVGMLVALAGCAGTTAEDTTASLTSAVSTGSSSGSSSGATANAGGKDTHHRGPPPEAFTACEGKAAGDACTVTHGNDSISGTCASPPPDASDTRLACRPDHMPEGGPPPGGGGPPGHDHAGGDDGAHGDCQGGKPAVKTADHGSEGPN